MRYVVVYAAEISLSTRISRSMDRIYQSDARTLHLCMVAFSSKYDCYSVYVNVHENVFRIGPDIHAASNLLDFFSSAGTVQSVLLKFFPRLLKLPRFLSPTRKFILKCIRYIVMKIFRVSFDYF